MSLRFRPPGRKASTPFPGAWPTTPVHENSSETSMNHAECNEASGKTKRIVKQTSRSENVDPPHLDHVVSFHKRISQSYAVFTRPRHPSNTAASATGFTNKQSPPTSPVLSEASTIPSEGIHTPEDYPMSFPPDPSLLSHKNSDNFNQLPHRPPRNPSRTFSLRRPTPDDITERRLSAIQLDSPLLNLSPNLHSFNTPSPEFAYSQMSTNPYFISVHDREIPGSDADLPEAPSYSSSLSSLAFAETIRNHSTTIPEFTITPPTGGELTEHNVLATSNSGSSIGIGTDSPVLPSEDGLSPVSAFRGRRYHSPGSHHLSPSSADMDAFGIAASNHTFSDSDSILSIPTSFQSASAQGSISADDTARGHATRQSSVSLSLSLDLSSNGPEGSSTGVQAYGDRAPPFCPPQHPDTRMRSGTIKGEVTVVASDEKPKKSFGKAARLLSIHKVKQLGTRIKKLFKGKPEPDDPGETVYGVTTTTNTVEYTSEHPIPRKRSASRKFGAPSSPPKSRTSPLLMFSKRRSMPAGAVSMPDVSQPRPLRPTSFLAMDGRNLSSSRHLVAMPSITGFLPRADEQPKKGQHRHSGYQQLIRPISKIRIDTTVSPVRRRIRTQTAPANHNDNSSTDPRRFSVASSIGEVIRATVAPHPFLPNKPTHPGTFGLAHRRSASTSARDAWNAAKRVPERDLESPIDPIDVSIPNSPQENIQEPVLQLPLEEAIHSDEEDVLSPVETLQESNERLTTVPDQDDRIRTRTQSTVRPNETIDQRSKRRSRGFSFSSVISKRALKARSFMAGRSNEPPVPALPTPEPRGHGFTASVSGISFDMITSGQSTHSQRDDRASGCAEFDPNIVIDKMSFAGTPGSPSTMASSMDFPFSSGPSATHPGVTPNEVYFSAESGYSATDDDDSSMEAETEESREFTRALGLEFDAIVNRARNE